ncbi:MAG: protein kinase [Gemmatimonadetes bacterium]|nr:protein kinase [Gemmatimonadota bacterium]
MKGPLSKGDVVGGRYKVTRFIGEGGMQFVYEAADVNLRRDVALKAPKNTSAEKRFHRSAIVSARINHPNVAKTLDYIETEDRPYLIEELVDGSDLDKALLQKSKYLDPYLVARIFHHLSKGMAASHHVGVVHRDLKPTNVMVVGGFQIEATKITDFGIAKMADEELAEAAEGGTATITTSQTAVGALPYMAPEAIDTPRNVGCPADVWSIGAMMYEILCGKKPFGTGLRAVHKIMEGKFPDVPKFVSINPQFAPLSNELVEIITSCLRRNPADRPTADQLVVKCGNLCYPVSKRYTGNIKLIKHNSWGFIIHDDGDVFFHFDSVYGQRPSLGSKVLFSKYSGGGAPRAHPIILLS